MTPSEALAEIRKRAKGDPQALLRALNLLNEELTGLRQHIQMRAGDPSLRERDIGYMQGTGNAIALVEEALFEAFDVRPDEDITEGVLALLDRLPSPDHTPDHMPLSREQWGAVLHALRSGDPAVRERVAAVVEAAASGRWHVDLVTPGLLARRVVDIGLPAPLPGSRRGRSRLRDIAPPGWHSIWPPRPVDGPEPRNPRA